MSDLTYATVGMTAAAAAEAGPDGGPVAAPPPGFRALRVRTRLAAGSYDRAAEALFGWRMHRATPLLRVVSADGDAASGVRVLLRTGPIRIPCEVVWTIHEPHRTGFAYGSLPGHPECGEESFVLRRTPDGSVDFTVLAFSHPAAWYLRAFAPAAHPIQLFFAHQYARTLHRLSRTP
ncbi:DUF1990 family protein [Streptomyces sp. NBC_01190]|uniref:DUF1990 family protein n=1 Tax=Streptomyces sp. NBC_01190 TaxID=2903767 RepID=UPI0038692F11|nr:DUF1990 domain-containing protein [Streptomyces sp. NBC_01190]